MTDQELIQKIAEVASEASDSGTLERIRNLLYDAGYFGERIGLDQFNPRNIAYSWCGSESVALCTYAKTGVIVTPEIFEEIEQHKEYLAQDLSWAPHLQEEIDELNDLAAYFTGER